jgi:hypothetical protein
VCVPFFWRGQNTNTQHLVCVCVCVCVCVGWFREKPTSRLKGGAAVRRPLNLTLFRTRSFFLELVPGSQVLGGEPRAFVIQQKNARRWVGSDPAYHALIIHTNHTTTAQISHQEPTDLQTHTNPALANFTPGHNTPKSSCHTNITSSHIAQHANITNTQKTPMPLSHHTLITLCVCVCVCMCWRCVTLTSQSSVERRTHAPTWLPKIPSQGRRDYPAHRSEPFTDSESN